MADDAAPTREVLCLAGKCFEPTINVLFQGITNGSQAIPSLDVKLEDSTQVKALALVQKAAEARFLRELTPVELTDVVIYATAAPALMGKKKITGEELCVCTEFEDEEPAGPLWIIVEIINAVIARARASAADQLYRALKTEAGMSNISFSDTNFAALLGKKCCVLTKALQRSKVEHTAADGKFVILIEERVAKYRSDLALLKRDLETMRGAAEMVRAAPF